MTTTATDLNVPADVVDWVRQHAPADMPEAVLPTLAAFVRFTDEHGRGARPRLKAVAEVLGIPPRKVSRYLETLRDAGLLVLDEVTEYPDLLEMPEHERPKVYDLGPLLREALAGPERGVTDAPGGITSPTVLPEMGMQRAAGVQDIPKAADYIAADNVVRELYEAGACFYGEPGRRMERLVAQALRNGWEQDKLLAFLHEKRVSIFEPVEYLLFVMERNLTPPWSADALYRKEPVPAAEIAGLVEHLVVHLNTARQTFDLDQVTVARNLLNAALATGMTTLDLMLILEEPTTWLNPGDEMLARVQKIVPGRPRPPASADRTRTAVQPTPEQLDRRLIRQSIERTHRLTFNQDQAHTLDNALRIAILNGYTHQDFFTIADRPLEGLDFPAVELVERYRGLGARR